jgi:hypothetical protein
MIPGDLPSITQPVCRDRILSLNQIAVVQAEVGIESDKIEGCWCGPMKILHLLY